MGWFSTKVQEPQYSEIGTILYNELVDNFHLWKNASLYGSNYSIQKDDLLFVVSSKVYNIRFEIRGFSQNLNSLTWNDNLRITNKVINIYQENEKQELLINLRNSEELIKKTVSNSTKDTMDKTALSLAIAILKGDKTARFALIDYIKENY